MEFSQTTFEAIFIFIDLTNWVISLDRLEIDFNVVRRRPNSKKNKVFDFQ